MPVVYTFNIKFIDPPNVQYVRETEKSENWKEIYFQITPQGEQLHYLSQIQNYSSFLGN